jgi:multidrug resistance efflux pump
MMGGTPPSDGLPGLAELLRILRDDPDGVETRLAELTAREEAAEQKIEQGERELAARRRELEEKFAARMTEWEGHKTKLKEILAEALIPLLASGPRGDGARRLLQEIADREQRVAQAIALRQRELDQHGARCAEREAALAALEARFAEREQALSEREERIQAALAEIEALQPLRVTG